MTNTERIEYMKTQELMAKRCSRIAIIADELAKRAGSSALMSETKKAAQRISEIARGKCDP